MIYLITNHHTTDKWIKIQSTYLEQNAPRGVDYKVCCGITETPESPYLKNKKENNYIFYNLDYAKNDHSVKLNELFEKCKKDFAPKDEDVLIFIDPDAFPISPSWVDMIKKPLEKEDVPFVAVCREENIEPLLREDQKPYPHACFSATTYGFWESNNLSWELDPAQGASCAGVLLAQWLKKHRHPWRKILRSNVYNLHPLNYAIYGGIIYHHGSGNRPTYDSVDIWSRPALANKYGVGIDLYYPKLLDFNEEISSLVFDYITEDKEFINYYFLGQ